MAVTDQVCCPNALVLGDDGLTAIRRISKSEASWRCGVWIGSIETSDEYWIGTPLGVIKSMAATALADGKRFVATAIDEMQGTRWRPPTKHRGISAQVTDEEHSGDDEKEEP